MTKAPEMHDAFGDAFADDAVRVGRDGREILLSHGGRAPKAIVLLHGLTATPRQFAAFARLLHGRGANVWVPRLPRHGHADRMSTALEGLTAEELDAFSSATVRAARDLGERVVVAGFSVGGLIAAWVAQHERVERAVAIAPFLGIAWLPSHSASALTRLLLRLPNHYVWWHPVQRERFGSLGYPRYPTHAIAQAHRLARRLLHDAGRAGPRTRDLVLVTNAREAAVDNAAVGRLARRWRASGAHVVQHRLAGLPPSHDIIQVSDEPSFAAHVYPALLTLVDGT